MSGRVEGEERRASYQYMWITLIVTQRMQIPNREQKDMIFWLTVFSEAARSSVLAHVESIAVFPSQEYMCI